MKYTFFIYNVLLLIIIFNFNNCYAQGDGARTFLVAPKGVTGVNPKWISLQQNSNPSGNILIDGAKFNVNIVPITLFHTFSINGKFAQVLAVVTPGTAKGDLHSSVTTIPTISSSGISNGFVGLKVGIVGASALSLSEFSNYKPAFSIQTYFRVWYSGTYDAKKALNLGSNTYIFELGFPVNIPFGKNTKRLLWLESFPSLQISTPNNAPNILSPTAKQSIQTPLFCFENHLSKSITDKFWLGLDARYMYGGSSKIDDVKKDDRNNSLGGGITAGFQFLPFLSASTSYGTIIFGDHNAKSNMFSLSLVFCYTKIKVNG